MANVKTLALAVRKVLENPFIMSNRWSVQGLGMLRLYMDEKKEVRLHIWNSQIAAEYMRQSGLRDWPSPMHDHPWDFKSTILAGKLYQCRYVPNDAGADYNFMTIQCGPGGCAKSQPEPIKLLCQPQEEYNPGDSYYQRADEIHISQPIDGTVTVIERTFHEDTEHARVFWQAGKEWVTAEPRDATPQEVLDFCTSALAMLPK